MMSAIRPGPCAEKPSQLSETMRGLGRGEVWEMKGSSGSTSPGGGGGSGSDRAVCSRGYNRAGDPAPVSAGLDGLGNSYSEKKGEF